MSKERPILFSAPMVRALLKGAKTQTRRLVKEPDWATAHTLHLFNSRPWASDPYYGDRDVPCPYGEPGDRLWVRETWAAHPDYPRRAVYRADPESKYDVPRWTPAIHMFRWASRIDLEVIGVRVERLHDISEAEAVAEGLSPQPGGGWGLADGSHFHATDPRISYWSLWEALYGPASLAANPLVWVVDFRKANP